MHKSIKGWVSDSIYSANDRPSLYGAARLSRRDFFSRMGDGLCGAAMAYLLGRDLGPPETVLAATNSALLI
jgi:hypothetical protein